MDKNNFRKSRFPKSRNLISDVMWLSKKKSLIHGLCEIDITGTRAYLKNYNSGSTPKVSLLSYMLFCYAKSLSKFESFNSFKKGMSVYTYEDVDISVIVERELNGEKYPMNYIIRNCNNKTIEEINSELITAKNTPLGEIMFNKKIRLFASLPAFVRRAIISYVARSPNLARQYFGTTGVTSVHTVSKGQFWGMPVSPASMTMTIGSIYKKYAPGNNGIEENDFLCVTMSAEHELNDGVNGIRLFNYMKDLVESGYGLKR
jgi:pyruvate/2-oxoglutarate dehydrogenase complex dihydrolipoamide acyltransferase (E2) component